jgi:calcineurin-like phosphoesterase family protein
VIFFTSDTHLGHARVIDYCKRPFRDVEHMDDELVRRWNARVGSDDTVYHLGDFAMGPKANLAGYRQRLNGRIRLVLGNHDRSYMAMREAGFDEVLKWSMPTLDGHPLFLRHIPRPWPLEAGIHLCGHVHERWRRQGNVINVGVDQWDFEPKTLQELLAAEDS